MTKFCHCLVAPFWRQLFSAELFWCWTANDNAWKDS